jgi:hypothetical protein
MQDTICNAYNHMPDENNSIEGILYDKGINPEIDQFIYYQLLECNTL